MWTNVRSGNKPPKRFQITSRAVAKAMFWFSCRADLKFHKRLKRSATLRRRKDLFCCRCTANFQPRDQDAAVARYEKRKVVVATNVAETSLTIDGVRLVIDSGLARIARYDSNRGINTLLHRTHFAIFTLTSAPDARVAPRRAFA